MGGEGAAEKEIRCHQRRSRENICAGGQGATEQKSTWRQWRRQQKLELAPMVLQIKTDLRTEGAAEKN